jgi:hypothetical protein
VAREPSQLTRELSLTTGCNWPKCRRPPPCVRLAQVRQPSVKTARHCYLGYYGVRWTLPALKLVETVTPFSRGSQPGRD